MAIDELLKLKLAVESLIAEAENERRSKAIADIELLMHEYDLTLKDIVPTVARRQNSKKQKGVDVASQGRSAEADVNTPAEGTSSNNVGSEEETEVASQKSSVEADADGLSECHSNESLYVERETDEALTPSQQL